jgi:threonine dehydratase
MGGDWPTLATIEKAAKRIEAHVHRTPILRCSAIDDIVGAKLFFKCENFQKIGAFKFRGALNGVMSLDEQTAARGVATHSSGNHGAAIALAARMRGISAQIIMPKTANAAKRRAVHAYGGSIVDCGPTLADRDAALAKTIRESGAEVIHPFNDYRVIAGQGTVALELAAEVPDVDAVVAPVGGGGLISGTALTLHEVSPSIEVIGCEPAGADDAHRSFKSGSLASIEKPETLADGLMATSLGALTYPIIQARLSDIALASEPGIVAAMRLIWERMKIVVEPSSAVALAGLMENELGLAGKRVGVILSGGNVDLDELPW